MDLKNKERVLRNEKEESRSCLQILMQVYRDFCQESTIHGIKYTTQAKTTTERLLWLMVVLVSLVFAGALASKFYDRHESANLRTTVVTNQFPSLKLAIPAVTICQGNLVSVERILPFLNMQQKLHIPSGLTIDDFVKGLHYLRELIFPASQYSEHLNKLQRILDANNLNVVQLLELVSHTCTDLLLVCVYEGRTESCDKLFSPTVTSYGICCSFNDASQRRKGAAVGRDIFSINFGTRYILSVLLRSYETNETLASITYGDGYKVIIHERYTLPGPNALEFMAGSALETIVGLRGTYLISSPEVLTSSQRDCRISTKTELYRSENCYIECRNRVILERCGCLPFYAINNHKEKMCNLTSIPCLANTTNEIYSLTLNDTKCNCLPDCEATKFTIAITGEPFNAPQFKPGKFFEKALQYPNSTALHITFAGQAAVLERKELVLSWINLMSSLGGVFSLFLGCSFISVIEIFYFFFYQFIKKLLIKYRKNPTVINIR